MNKRTKINIAEWNRAELFREFIGMRTSVYDMSVCMDVTKLAESRKFRFRKNGFTLFFVCSVD